MSPRLMCSLNFHSHPEKKNQNVLQKTLRNIIKFHNDSRTIVHPPPEYFNEDLFMGGANFFGQMHQGMFNIGGLMIRSSQVAD